MSKKTNNQTAKVNWPITILLIIGCLTVFFSSVYGSDHCVQTAV